MTGGRCIGGLVHHSDRGSQYVSIKYTERLAEAGIEPSVGSVGDSYDNALAETINGLYKAEVIHRRGPWRSFEAVEFATLEWVDWFNHRRPWSPSATFPRQKPKSATTLCSNGQPWQRDSNQIASDKPGTVQQRQYSLLFHGLDWDEPHIRPPDCFADRFRIGGIGLVPLHIRLHVLRGYQADLMAKPGELASPMVST
jgi:hypothetical protein